MLKGLMYRAGAIARNSAIIDRYNFLLQSQRWSRERLKYYQYQQLVALLHHAYDKSEYYRTKFDEAGFDPRNFTSLSHIQNIPLTTKEDLLNNARRIQIRDRTERLFYSETSGSTGKPLVFYRNKDWDAWHRASVYRGYSWYGVKPWDRNGYLWGYNSSFKKRVKTQLLDFLQNRFRLFSYKEGEIDQFISKLTDATYLSGYSSMIYEIARRINARNDSGLRFTLKMVKGTSEKIFDRYQPEVRKAFGRPITSEYGAAEAGIIAFECAQGNMHTTMETVIVEEVNGETIVTNLVSKSFPIIRYKLGDYIRLDRDTKCGCGMEHEIVREVMGRVGKVIYGVNHQYPSLTLYYVFKNLAMESQLILNYQAFQSDRGHLVLNIEEKLGDAEARALKRELIKYFDDDLSVDIRDQVTIALGKGKRTDFVSSLPN